MAQENKPIFRDFNAEDDPEVTEIESLCMNCHKNGITRLLLTKIPFYKEVVIMSFSCENCDYQNNEIQSSGQVAEKGIRITLQVKTEEDLNRQVVKSDYTSVMIVELDFEIPSNSQRGEITTVEGVIERSIKGLEQDQPTRRKDHPEIATQIEEFLEKLKDLKTLKAPFTLVLEDISGNCHISNPSAPQNDPQCTKQAFQRDEAQNRTLGFYPEEEIAKQDDGLLHPIAEDEFPLSNLEGEVLQFPTNCHECGTPCETNMKLTKIPHFKEVVIMATTCDACGNRTNEVKSGSGIEAKGIHMEIQINNKEDLSRDILKSETCHLFIPELELEVGPTTLGGRFTTVEGILIAIKDQLSDHIVGDSQEEVTKNRLEQFFLKFDQILEGRRKVTMILDDPAGNSYIQSMGDDDKADEFLKISHYDRNFDQNEELGLNDMRTENYETL